MFIAPARSYTYTKTSTLYSTKWSLSVSSIMNDNNVASLVVVKNTTKGGATRIISLHPYSFVHFLLPMGTVQLFMTSNNKSNSRLFYYLIDLEFMAYNYKLKIQFSDVNYHIY